MAKLLLLLFLVCSRMCVVESDEETFKWGVATAAYQIEGAASSYGRGPSIWDTFSTIPGKIANNDTGFTADDSYHHWEKDIQLIQNMGLNSYRFSISWSRILPNGTGAVNREGVAYYNKIINKLVELNVDPFVTIYHWDLPQALEDRYQGWLSPKIAVDFGHYAGVLFREFGDRVKHWITVNEPWTFCYLGYVTGAFAPGRCSDRTKCPHGDSATEGYIAAHNVILSHATAVDLYRSSYQPAQKGTIGITVNLDWAEALNPDSVEDLKSAERWRQFVLGWFLDPLVYGTYPPAMIENVGARLPVFSAADAKKVKGSFDFIGLNHYSTKYTTHIPVPSPSSGWYDDMGVNETVYDRSGRLIGPQGDSTWLHVVPWGFYKLLKWVKNRYGNPTLFITENGCDVPNESGLSFSSVIQDDFRISYYSQYLKALDQAVFEGSDIRGYFAWSLLDNFEWADGYAFRFGLHYVNYSDPALPRYPKMSSVWYAQYIQSHRYKLENKEKDPSKHPGIDWGAHQYWKESYAYVNVLGPGKPVFGVYGTGY